MCQREKVLISSLRKLMYAVSTYSFSATGHSSRTIGLNENGTVSVGGVLCGVAPGLFDGAAAAFFFPADDFSSNAAEAVSRCSRSEMRACVGALLAAS